MPSLPPLHSTDTAPPGRRKGVIYRLHPVFTIEPDARHPGVDRARGLPKAPQELRDTMHLVCLESARSLAAREGRSDDAEKIHQFQFKDIRPKAASEIIDLADASLLLGHSEQEITKRVYRRIGAIAQPSK